MFLYLSSFSQKNEAKLLFRDGTEVIGLAKITIDNKIKFKKSKKEDAVKYDFRKVDKVFIKLKRDNYFKEYQYKIELGKNYPKLYEVIIQNNLSLFRLTSNSSSSTLSYSTAFDSFSYYIGKIDEDLVRFICYGGYGLATKSYKKRMRKHFSNCKELMKKVENKDFKRGDIEKIIHYYNGNCTIK